MRFAAVPATVFVADGAGNFQMTSMAVRNVLKKDGYPIDVITYEWSHGKNRIFLDQLDYTHARCEGKKLAAVVLEYHASHPDCPIYLLGHSAGTTTLLAALEQLPPQVVDRAILLAPSISTHYDILPALRNVKDALYVFYSPHDFYYLGIITRILGNSDGNHSATAGRVGFHLAPNTAEPELVRKLVQRPWQPIDSDLGNQGGHFGTYQPDFLRVHVIPLLNPHSACPAGCSLPVLPSPF